MRLSARRTGPIGRRAADQCVQVGPVQVDLAAVPVDHVANLANVLLEHPVRGGVGDHQCRQVFAMGFRFFPEVIHIDVSFFIAPDDDDFHAGDEINRR